MRDYRLPTFTAMMLPLALLLAGCAAGSPATIAPTPAPGARLAAVQTTSAPPTEPPAILAADAEPDPTSTPAPPQPPADAA
ncbi:MAG: hypothetical protein IT337_04085, partial [Thermomicrobiales bacterium]|nr:hypothetical protein [Thermomicrobiales bacterium]